MTAGTEYHLPRRTCPRCAQTLPAVRFLDAEAVLCCGCAGRSPRDTLVVGRRTIARRYSLTDKARHLLARDRAGLS